MTIEFLNYLYKCAQAKDKLFHESNYKWVLGVRVLDIITNENVLINNSYSPMTLYGIPVEKDRCDPSSIQLWKNVTHDICED